MLVLFKVQSVLLTNCQTHTFLLRQSERLLYFTQHIETKVYCNFNSGRISLNNLILFCTLFPLFFVYYLHIFLMYQKPSSSSSSSSHKPSLQNRPSTASSATLAKSVFNKSDTLTLHTTTLKFDTVTVPYYTVS
jgi:hypothetical protein